MKNLDTTNINSVTTKNIAATAEESQFGNTLQDLIFDNIYILLLVLSALLIFFLFKSKNKGIILSEEEFSKSDKSDFGNVFSGLSNQKEAKQLKDKLIRKCHPDRFPNDEKLNQEASRLTSLVNKNAYDLIKLKDLQIEIDNVLFK